MARAQITGRGNIFQSYCEQPLYANFVKLGKEHSLLLSDQGGGLHNGESFEITIDLMNSSLRCISPSAQLVLPHADSEKNQRAALFKNTVSLKNSRLFYFPKPLILTQDANVHLHQQWELSSSSEFACLDIVSCGRSSHGESYRFSALENTTELRLDGKLQYLEHWRLGQSFPLNEEKTAYSQVFSPATFRGAKLWASGLFYGDRAIEYARSIVSLWQKNSDGNNSGVELALSQVAEGLYSLKALDYQGIALNRSLDFL